MYDYFEDNGTKTLLAIGYSKSLYDAQVTKVRNEEYIKDLLLEDYVRKIRAHQSRYDFIGNIFVKAQKEVNKKLKKERPNLETIKSFISEDFLDNDKKFKIHKIIACGLEDYAWRVELTGYGKTIFVEIPMVRNINVKNVEYAHHGQFAFGECESEYCYSVLKYSYEIKVIAKFIEEYLKDVKGLKKEESNESDKGE